MTTTKVGIANRFPPGRRREGHFPVRPVLDEMSHRLRGLVEREGALVSGLDVASCDERHNRLVGFALLFRLCCEEREATKDGPLPHKVGDEEVRFCAGGVAHHHDPSAWRQPADGLARQGPTDRVNDNVDAIWG